MCCFTPQLTTNVAVSHEEVDTLPHYGPRNEVAATSPPRLLPATNQLPDVLEHVGLGLLRITDPDGVVDL